MKLTKNYLRKLVEEAIANIGIDKSLLNYVLRDLNKIKDGTINLREKLTPAQFDDFNKALNKIYSLLESTKENQ